MRPRCSILTGGFDFSGCGDFISCPPVERAEMSNSEPSAIVLHGIACMRGIIHVSIRMEKSVRSSIFNQGSSRFTPSRSPREPERQMVPKKARHFSLKITKEGVRHRCVKQDRPDRDPLIPQCHFAMEEIQTTLDYLRRLRAA